MSDERKYKPWPNDESSEDVIFSKGPHTSRSCNAETYKVKKYYSAMHFVKNLDALNLSKKMPRTARSYNGQLLSRKCHFRTSYGRKPKNLMSKTSKHDKITPESEPCRPQTIPVPLERNISRRPSLKSIYCLSSEAYDPYTDSSDIATCSSIPSVLQTPKTEKSYDCLTDYNTPNIMTPCMSKVSNNSSRNLTPRPFLTYTLLNNAEEFNIPMLKNDDRTGDGMPTDNEIPAYDEMSYRGTNLINKLSNENNESELFDTITLKAFNMDNASSGSLTPKLAKNNYKTLTVVEPINEWRVLSDLPDNVDFEFDDDICNELPLDYGSIPFNNSDDDSDCTPVTDLVYGFPKGVITFQPRQIMPYIEQDDDTDVTELLNSHKSTEEVIETTMQEEKHLNWVVRIGKEEQGFCGLMFSQYSQMIRKMCLSEETVELDETKISMDGLKLINRFLTYDNFEIPYNGFSEVIQGAIYLELNDIVVYCWNIAEQIKNSMLCFGILSTGSRYTEIAQLQETLMAKIHTVFLSLAGSLEFHQLPERHVKFLLNCNTLGVNSEIEVLYAALDYLSYEWPKRKDNVVDILCCVRYSFVTPHFLTDLTKNHERLQLPPEQVEVLKFATESQCFNEAVSSGIVYNSILRIYGSSKEKLLEQLGRCKRKHISQRIWIQDPACPYHQPILNNLPTNYFITYTEYQEYITTLMEKEDDGYLTEIKAQLSLPQLV